MTSKWLVHKDAVEGGLRPRDADHVWQATNEQDGALVGRAQRGVRDPGYVPGPYSPFTERYLDLFATWLGRLQAHGADRKTGEAPVDATIDGWPSHRSRIVERGRVATAATATGPAGRSGGAGADRGGRRASAAAGRLERLRAELRRADVAGALLTDPINLRYATGSRNMALDRTTAAATPSSPPRGRWCCSSSRAAAMSASTSRPSTSCAPARPSPTSSPARAPARRRCNGPRRSRVWSCGTAAATAASPSTAATRSLPSAWARRRASWACSPRSSGRAWSRRRRSCTACGRR